MKKVLAFGYLPKWRGGKQSTGLATGLFDLHNAVNEVSSEFEVTIAATDVFKKHYHTAHIDVLGWTKSILLKHMIKHFYRLPFFFSNVYKISKRYSTIPILDTFIKMVFLDYAIEIVKPDIIHLHGVHYALFINALWKNGKPVVLRLHGLNGFDSTIHGYEDYRRMEKEIIDYNYSVVTFVTTDVCEDWKVKYGSFKCPMIPIINGYNKDVFFTSDKPVEKEYDLITISGIQDRKGQGRVIEAMKMLKDDGVNLSYLVIGSGYKDYVDYYKKYAKDNDLKVDFLEYCPQNQLNKFLWKSKWFIQPSASEGFGKTYVESAAAGVPFILPIHLPIVKERGVVTSVNAIMTKDESVKEIYNTLKTIDFSVYYDPKTVAESVAHLSWQSLAKTYEEIYRGL